MPLNDKKLRALEFMADNSDLGTEQKLFRGMFYGDPGAGKTCLATEIALALGGKAMFLTTDPCWEIIRKYNRDDVLKRFEYDGLSQLEIIGQAHTEGLDFYKDLSTIVVDTIDGAVDEYLRMLVRTKKDPKIVKQQPDPEVEGWPHFRIAGRALLDTIKETHKHKLNVIYLAHFKNPNESDLEKRDFGIRPAMPSDCFKSVHRNVHMMGYVYRDKKGDSRKVQLEGTTAVKAKSQLHSIPERTYTTTELVEHIKNWRND